MNNDVKISLTITLPGSVMLSQVAAGNKPENYDLHSMVVEDVNTKNKSKINFSTRKSIPATQTIKLTQDAYDEMSSDMSPYWAKPEIWKLLTPEQRVIAHLKRITQSLGGTKFSYEVFSD